MQKIIYMINKGQDLINPYLNEKYFLYIMGSIFLLGIVGQWITKAIYARLIRKAKNMVTTENRMLKKIKIKYENYAALNGTVTNSGIMVRQYINKYKVLGITLSGLKKISGKCAVLALLVSGVTGFLLYKSEYEKITIMSYVLVGCFVAFALSIYEKSQGIEESGNELVCIITDFLENTLSSKGLRLERTSRTLEMLKENEKEEIKEHLPIDDIQGERYEPKVIHELMDEEDDIEEDELRKQERIINEVLAEFLL